MKLKKLLVSILSFALICSFAIVPMTVSAVRECISLAFSYGKEFNGDSYFTDTDIPETLFINGKGRMYDFKLVSGQSAELSDDFTTRNSAVYNNSIELEQKEPGYEFFNQKNVVIGDGITYIGDNVFTFCDRLEKIYIPDSVTEISKNIILKKGLELDCLMRYNNDPSKITICCSKDSYAYQYAVDNGFKVDTESEVPQSITTTNPTTIDPEPTTPTTANPSTTNPTKYKIEIEDDLSVGKVEYTYRDDGVLLLDINFNPGMNMNHSCIVDWEIEGDYKELGGSLCRVEYWIQVNSDLKIKPIYHGISTLTGDSNADGKLTAADVLLTRKHIAGQNLELCTANADVNGDGKITASDVLIARKMIAGQQVILTEKA